MSQPLNNWENGIPVLPLGNGKGDVDIWAAGAPVLKKPKQRVRATLARSQTAATIAAAGLEKFLGTSSLTQTAATIAAAGLEKFLGTSSLTQSAQTISAAGSLIFTGTAGLTQSPHTTAEVGIEVFTGTAALDQSTHTLTAAGLVLSATSSFVIAGGGIRLPKKRPYRWGDTVPDPISGQAALVQSAHRMQAAGTVIARLQPIGEASSASLILDPRSASLTSDRVRGSRSSPLRLLPTPPAKRSAAVYVVQSRHGMRARGNMSTERLELEEALLCLLLLTAANS